jgi:hypothetical protein
MKKFNLGDRVRLLKTSGINRKGEIGTITEESTNYYHYNNQYRVQVPGNQEFGNWAIEEDLELVKASDSIELTVEVEFVKRAHAAACREWKAILERKFPQVFGKTYSVGDKFHVTRYGGTKEVFMLSRAGEGNQVALVSLLNGNLWSKIAEVSDLSKITEEELAAVFGEDVSKIELIAMRDEDLGSLAKLLQTTK